MFKTQRHVLKYRSQDSLADGHKAWTHSYNTGHLRNADRLVSASEMLESYMNVNPQHKSPVTNGPFHAKYHEHNCIIIETREHQFALIATEMFYI